MTKSSYNINNGAQDVLSQ
jgi:translation elongation factor EF-G